MSGIAIGIHGGCGTLDRSLQSEQDWAESRDHLAQSLLAGWSVLKAGGSAIDAVQAAVVVMENSPHFNAGYGAALNENSRHELDASIMDGATLAAGAVSAVARTRNPVLAARAVMDSGKAVLLTGPAADRFAEQAGLAMVPPDYFTTQRRVDALASLKKKAQLGTILSASEAEKHGTVGAVARDAKGHLAAATSTGGFNNKPEGRVGDTPIIGAGTYAEDGTVAVSCTGQGEIFIRRVAAYDLAARIRLGHQPLGTAAENIVHQTLGGHGIGAGLIALGPHGNPVAPSTLWACIAAGSRLKARLLSPPIRICTPWGGPHDSASPILIWGAGAIGGTLGAYWARAGLPVTMVDVVAEHAEACSTRGLAITGPVESFTQVVPCITPDKVTGLYPIIVLAVKAQATEAALTMLKPHLAADGYVLSAQNGLNEITIAKAIGEDRTMGCFVNFGADWLGPGEILFGNRGAVVVGEIDGSIRPRTRQIFADLQMFEPDAVLTDNIWGYLWGKLAYGAMLFATALTPDSMTANFDDPRRTIVFDRLAREVMMVATARGVTPVGFNGFDPAAFAPGADPEGAKASIARLAEFNRYTAKSHSGIYRDLAVRKRKTEVDPQIGVIADLGAEAGLATPAIRHLVSLIHDIEEGREPMAFATFEKLIATCTSASTSA